MYGIIVLIINFILLISSATELPPTCDSKVYCEGDLLHIVQLSNIFNDSKHFVDMRMLYHEHFILDKFEQLLSENKHNLSKAQVSEFVNEYFAVGDELEEWIAPDYNPSPKFLQHIDDDEVRSFAGSLVQIWPKLTRRIKPEVLRNIEQYSLLPLPNGFVIPGGRFRETYYWDTYWIIKGLLISEMHETVRGMLENFIHQINLHGFIPNGGRVYYTRRSQPPLFVPMVMEYYMYTKNKKWLSQNIATCDKELRYWLEHKSVPVYANNKMYMLARYKPESSGPRSESYREDYNVAKRFSSREEQQNIYTALKGAAESGWDFSSRWFYGDNLTSINTTRSIPVDLNSYIYKACYDLYLLYQELGMSSDAVKWRDNANKFKLAINAVFWNNEEGMWFDYDLATGKHRNKFYVSNLTPLWVSAFDGDDLKQEEQILDYLTKNRVLDYFGGTPTSLDYSGEQWDYPNAWPPLQSILVEGLRTMKSPRAKSLAEVLAKRWIAANIIGFNATGEVYEKYDAVHAGSYGGGGEYVVQTGFGWTNGVALGLINDYYTN